MWTTAGQRVTALPGFKPDASPEIREIYRRHARGNSLFRNRGDGTFEDVTVAAGAEFGRWAWSSDAFDFDNDGWEDLYVANGMFTRSDDDASFDVDSFFWRQVVAQSPLERKPGTSLRRRLARDEPPADEQRGAGPARAQRAPAQRRPRRVRGRLRHQRPRRRPGRPVLRGVRLRRRRPTRTSCCSRPAPRRSCASSTTSSPAGHSALVLRLTGTKSNRDAVGARVTVETEEGRATRVLMAGSGFLSQHSKELLFGLGRSRRIVKVDDPLAERPRADAHGRPHRPAGPGRGRQRRAAERAVPEGERAFDGGHGGEAGRRGRRAPRRRLALRAVPRARLHAARPRRPGALAVRRRPADAPPLLGDLGPALARAPAGARAPAPGASPPRAPRSSPCPSTLPRTRRRSAAPPETSGVPVLMAGEEVAGTYSILHSYLFDRREDLRLPTLFLLSAKGEIVKLYRELPAAAQIAEDIARIDALAGRAARPRRAVHGQPVLEPRRAQLLPVRAGALRAGLRRAGSRRLRARGEGRSDARSRSSTSARST